MNGNGVTTGKYGNRDSGIEILKIIAMFLIVLNHCVMSITEASGVLPSADCIIDINSGSTVLSTIIISILRSTGCVGNDIFVACSAWFLIGSKGNGRRKALFLILETWIMSVIIFFVTLAFGCDLDRDSTLKQFFPVGNSNNWFVTCFILLMLIYPLLNKLIEWMSQKALLAATLVMIVLYSIFNFFRPWFFDYGPYFVSELVIWIMIYFIIAYIKLYMKDISASTGANIACLLIGLFGHAAVVVINNFAGLWIPMFAGRGLYYVYSGSPFILLLVVGALNLAKRGTFRCRFINYVSGLSLLTYIIHENYILRYNYRPWIFYYIYETFGYEHVILWLLLATLAIFVAALLISAAFKETIERLVRRLSDWLYGLLSRVYHKLESKLLKLH